jgi:hypothetical protein
VRDEAPGFLLTFSPYQTLSSDPDNYALESFPEGYRLFEHVKGAVGKTPRTDLYLFGVYLYPSLSWLTFMVALQVLKAHVLGLQLNLRGMHSGL